MPTSISAISPFFIVTHVPSTLAFYRDRLGFDITFEGPTPDDIYFGIVRRGGAQILFKSVGVPPAPNCTRDIKQGIARWDAYLEVPDPDALAAEFASRQVEFLTPLNNTEDGLRGFELKDPNGYVLFFGRTQHPAPLVVSNQTHEHSSRSAGQAYATGSKPHPFLRRHSCGTHTRRRDESIAWRACFRRILRCRRGLSVARHRRVADAALGYCCTRDVGRAVRLFHGVSCAGFSLGHLAVALD